MHKWSAILELLNAKRYEEAKILLEELLLLDPQDTDTLYNLGMCNTELGKFQEAIQLLLECININPRFSNAHVALGVAYSHLGDHEQAKTSLLSAIEIDNDNSYGLRNLGALQLGEGDIVYALVNFKKAFDINPNDIQTIYGLGLSNLKIKDFVNATIYLKKVISEDSSSPIAELARTHLREIAVENVKSEGFRADAMFYCIAALQLFEKMPYEKMKQTTFEIALKGRDGFDINNPEIKYTLDSMEGAFTGLQLVSYMYVGFQKIQPDMNVGVDLSSEYKMALEYVKKPSTHGHTIH